MDVIWEGLLLAAERGLVLRAPDRGRSEAPVDDELLRPFSDGVSITTGVWGGKVTVRVEYSPDDRGLLDGELSSGEGLLVLPAGEFEIGAIGGQPQQRVQLPARGAFGIRVFGSGRDRDFDLVVDKSIEEYTIRLWSVAYEPARRAVHEHGVIVQEESPESQRLKSLG